MCGYGLITGGGQGGDGGSVTECSPFPGVLTDLGLTPLRLSLGASGQVSMMFLTLTVLSPMCLVGPLTS
jgi:hypothetical protein